MSISINTPYSNSLYQISETRAERLLSGDKKQATYMGLWDKFKDYFRTEKKIEVMERLYDFIHSTDDSAIHKGTENYTSFSKEITSFLLLKSLATEQHKSDFLIVSNPDKSIDFHIGSEKIKTLNNGQILFSMLQVNCCNDLKESITKYANDTFQTNLEMAVTHYDDLIQNGGALEDEVTLFRDMKDSCPRVQLKACFEAREYGMRYVMMGLDQKSAQLCGFNADFDQPIKKVEFDPNSSKFTVTHTLYRKNAFDKEKAHTTNETSLFQRFYVSFTVSEDGRIECESLHADDNNTEISTNEVSAEMHDSLQEIIHPASQGTSFRTYYNDTSSQYKVFSDKQLKGIEHLLQRTANPTN